MVTLHTNHGDIIISLYADKAPKTVANFKQYVEDGFYSGTIFHRVIKNFMIQGGGMEPGMKEKTSRANIENEANNGVANDIGTIAMARTPDPHSASSQFFINIGKNAFLNFKDETADGWGYCAFGKVTDGMDVVNKIANTSTGSQNGHSDVPTEDVIIESADWTDA